MVRGRALRRAALVAGCGLALLTWTATSRAAGRTDAQRSAISAYAKGFGVSASRAEANLAQQAAGAGLDSALKKALGDGYAGVRFDNQAGRWEIGIGPNGDRAAARAAAAASGVLRPAIVRRAFSVASLRQASDRLHAALTPAQRQAVTESIDPVEGLQVHIDAAASASVRSAVGAALGRDLADDAASIESAPPLEPGGGCNAGLHCDPPMRAGMHFANNHWNCTTAFAVASPVNGNQYLLTAGHCAFFFDSSNVTCTLTVCPPLIGPVVGAYYGGGDAGLLQVTNLGLWGSAYPAWVNWPGDTGAGIFGVEAPYVGQFVCHTGIRTLTSCGTVDNIHFGTSYAAEGGLPAASFYDMISVVNVPNAPVMCGGKGDSGGPLVNPYTGAAVGIYSGQTADDDNAHLCDPYRVFIFEPVARAAANLGVYVKHL